MIQQNVNKKILQEALDYEIITKSEAEAMDPRDKGPGKLYCTFKVYKENKQTETDRNRQKQTETD